MEIIKGGGGVYTWGANIEGVLGIGDLTCEFVCTPTKVNLPEKMQFISSGAKHSFSISRIYFPLFYLLLFLPFLFFFYYLFLLF